MALRRCLRPATLSTISLRSHLPVAPVADNGSIALIAASAQAAAINLRLPRAPAYPVLASTSLAPSTIVAVALNAPVSTVEVPRLDASTEAIVHEETSPAVDIGGMTVTPTRSYFQSDTVGLRLRWPISWALRDPRGIAWILKMDDDERADILYTAYDTLEASADLDEQIAARDPDHPDALEHWQSLRERYRKPEPPARQRGLDTTPKRDWSDWERWADGRIGAALNHYDKAVGQALGEASKDLRDEIAALRRELATARNRIKALEQRRNVDAERRNRRLARQPQSLFGHAV